MFSDPAVIESIENRLIQSLPNKEKHQKIFLQWENFINGDNEIDDTLVPADVLKAWERCRWMNIDPLTQPENATLPDGAFQALLEQNRQLIDVSDPFLDKLFEFVEPSGFTVALFNSQGYLLKVRSDKRYDKVNRRFSWSEGMQWTEEKAGNNSISMALALKRPVQLFGTLHYKKRFHSITASSAPIANTEGQVIGGIALAAFYIGTNPHTLSVCVAAARAIENEMRFEKAMLDCHKAFERSDIADSLQKAVISSIPEAVIAFNATGRVSLINDRAMTLFGLNKTDAEGRTLAEIFPGEENITLLRYLSEHDKFHDVEMRITTSKGTSDFSISGNPIVSMSGQNIGQVVIFSEIKRIKSLITKVIGAKANFSFKDIYGRNELFQGALEQAVHIAQSSSNVLILGESGTGKDLFAQAIHNASPRKNAPYVAINCGAIPRDLIASELFGYSEGAFTGSRRGGNTGKFELADGGTIFLDEIAETPLEIQAVLLRVIEDKCVIRIGSGKIRAVNVRIISATNKDLLEEVRLGAFRKDLYYRLNVFNIQLPSLRDRTDDIPTLVDTFITKYASTLGKKITSVSPQAMNILLQHAWPGNVRELQNVIERMVNYAESNELTAELIPLEISQPAHLRRRSMDIESPEDQEKELIAHMLNLKYKKKLIAEQLNVSRTTLFRKMLKYNLSETDKD